MATDRKKSKKLYASNWLKGIRRKRNIRAMYKRVGKKRVRNKRRGLQPKELSL